MKLIIQIPCFNEEKTLPQTVADLPRQIDGIDCIEYLIINDGSSDNTVEAARKAGIHHIVSLKRNSGLARVFKAGIDACLKLGADIVVNTDADNQYKGGDIVKLVQPILNNEADMVIGERPIMQTEHFSKKKKFFQRFGSWVVRTASGTRIPDAPSGFRAYSRDMCMQINVFNEYTYTLETIIQAGNNKIALKSVSIGTNPETRPSRLFKSMWKYMSRSASVIVRSFMMYHPLKFFSVIGAFEILCGFAIGVRYLFFLFTTVSPGHVQSLILAAILILLGFQTITTGLQADLISANRKILEDIQYRIKKIYYGEN